MPDDRAPNQPPEGPLKTPQPPSQEATRDTGEGDGPFGADMTNLLGGERACGGADAPMASPYSTGTDASTGHSLTPGPRSTYGGRTTPTGEAPPNDSES